MKLLYEEMTGGMKIQRCYGLDGMVELPEEIRGQRVTELDRYLFSQTVRGRQRPPGEYEGEPELCGENIKALTLPEHVKKVGAYAFYNCDQLEVLSVASTIEDWGPGVFTGCTGIRRLDIGIVEGKKSCFQEILSELHQTLEVNYRDHSGNQTAKLIFPEYFEESVENTPARIIMRQMHGCGHMYRYCFDNTVFQFQEYDALFPYVQAQEKPELVTRLALYRLFWPMGLKKEYQEEYWKYIKKYPGQALSGLLVRGERELLPWLSKAPAIGEAELEQMQQAAAERKDAESCALLMDAKHRRFGCREKAGTKRTFEL